MLVKFSPHGSSMVADVKLLNFSNFVNGLAVLSKYRTDPLFSMTECCIYIFIGCDIMTNIIDEDKEILRKNCWQEIDDAWAFLL
jgi:hypothetical protein